MNLLQKLARQSQKTLTEQAITADGPGTILRDVETLLGFIVEQGLVTKSRQGNLPAEVLPALNERLAPAVALDLTRPLLRDYPNIAGPFVLLRVMGLVRVNGKCLQLDPPVLAFWRGLNPTEKYFALLEAWLFHADAGVLGGADERRLADQLTANLRFLSEFKGGQWKGFDENCHRYEFCGAVSAWNTQLHARFGLIEVRPRSLANRRGEGHGWIMAKGRRTPWGEAVAWALLEHLAATSSDDEDDDADLFLGRTPEGADHGFFQPIFQRHFPEWEKVFQPAEESARAGVYVFKVKHAVHRSTNDVWRRLAVPGGATLDEVASAVLKAFKFDDREHLYDFRFRDRLGMARAYFHPDSEEGHVTSEITVDALGLPERGVMKFLFDYGASWHFELQLERIDPPDKKMRTPKVIGSAGRAPKQYRGWN